MRATGQCVRGRGATIQARVNRFAWRMVGGVGAFVPLLGGLTLLALIQGDSGFAAVIGISLAFAAFFFGLPALVIWLVRRSKR